MSCMSVEYFSITYDEPWHAWYNQWMTRVTFYLVNCESKIVWIQDQVILNIIMIIMSTFYLIWRYIFNTTSKLHCKAMPSSHCAIVHQLLPVTWSSCQGDGGNALKAAIHFWGNPSYPQMEIMHFSSSCLHLYCGTGIGGPACTFEWLINCWIPSSQCNHLHAFLERTIIDA